MMEYNILIVGVGGQGTLLASRILGNLAGILGLEVKLSEVHGMAQRGGSVVTHTKMAKKVYSPVISEGTADFIIAFEQLEAMRYTALLKDTGSIIVNTQTILPMPVIIGAQEYPKNPVEQLSKVANVIAVDALCAANECGNSRVVNVVMLGVLLCKMGIEKSVAVEALKRSVKPEFLDFNLKAIEKGYVLACGK